MDNSNGYSSNYHHSAPLSSSVRDVSYSCGSCGYDLNLSSSSRNTSNVSSNYGKSIKKGTISFLSIDENRFKQVEDVSCVPYFISKHLRGLFHWRTKLLCQNCGKYIGTASDDKSTSYHFLKTRHGSHSDVAITNTRKYNIRIRSLQPSSAGFGTPLVI